MDDFDKLIKTEFTQDEIDSAIKLMESFSDKSEQLTLLTEEQRVSLLKASGKLSRPDRTETNHRRPSAAACRPVCSTDNCSCFHAFIVPSVVLSTISS